MKHRSDQRWKATNACDWIAIVRLGTRSEHALGPFKLLRKTDWEIHPVYRLEFCPKGENCPDDCRLDRY